MDNDKYIGRLLDNRYEILENIGVGGMAVVYKARCHRLNRLVAIKILKDDYCQDEEFRRRFHAEGQAVAMVSHPNIVSVYDVSTSQEADYIVMELIDGISLKQYMEKKGVLNWKETLHFAIQIGKALEHAHSRGIVHRDIKPHNVMVLKNGSVKVADFGIARVMSESHTLTREALGSVHYISPEQAKGGRVDDRSDLYSLGVVMYEMITGRPPYDGESPVAVAIQHINGGAKMPSVLNPNIPGGLEQIIMKAMANDPAARYTSAAAMLYDMDEFRKLPSMLFDYNTPPLDAVTQLRPAQAAQGGKPQTTQPPASGRNQPPRRTAAQLSEERAKQKRAERYAESGRSTQSPRRREKYEEEERSKVATIAVVVCSVVAIVAIVIFLITLLGGGDTDSGKTVIVPTLIGKNYDTLQVSEDLILNAPQWRYDDLYPEGQIVDQNPSPGDEVSKGTRINITISLGKMPPVKVMEDLVGQDRITAQNYLTGQDLLYLCKEEYSDTVKEGQVTRTDPAEGATLKDGQIVTLYISIGPKIRKVDMPNLVNQSLANAKKLLDGQELSLVYVEKEEENAEIPAGFVIRTEPAYGQKVQTGDTVTIYVSSGPKTMKMPKVEGKDLTTALEMLEYAGFTNVKYDTYVDSDLPENQVVSQSVEANKEIPLTTAIELILSKGPTEPVKVTKTVTFGLMDGMTEDYRVIIKDEAGNIVFDQTIPADQSAVDVLLTGSGEQKYTVYINDEDSWFSDQTVVFE